MKKTKHINLDRMRKTGSKVTMLGGATMLLSACDATEPVEIVTSTLDCMEDTPLAMAQCQTTYQRALEESRDVAPRYRSEYECEAEFGRSQCEDHLGYFIPVMAGYLFANSLWDNDRSRYGANFVPVYRYFRPFSPLHNQLVTADGEVIGEDDDGVYKMKKKKLKKKSKGMLMSRGGFGSYSKKLTSSRSSWGG